MKDLMLDIETLGNKTNSVILSIGACYFDPTTGEIGETLNIHINAQSCVDVGLNIDTSTVLWWIGQESDAQAELLKGQEQSMPISEALLTFNKFIYEGTQVWGNGASFDNAIIKNAYEKTRIPIPWEFWNDRDVRTIVELGYQIGFNPKRDMPFKGVRHSALDDAIHQAKYVSAIWQRLLHKYLGAECLSSEDNEDA